MFNLLWSFFVVPFINQIAPFLNVVVFHSFVIAFSRYTCKGGIYESMTIENIYRVFMKLVIRPKENSDYGAYKCIANNTLGETEKVVHLHRKLIYVLLWINYTEIDRYVLFPLYQFILLTCVATDKLQSSDSRNFVVANQVDDSTEVMNSGNSFPFIFLFFFVCQKIYSQCIQVHLNKTDRQTDGQREIDF